MSSARPLGFDEVAAVLGLGPAHEVWRPRFDESAAFAAGSSPGLPSAAALPGLCEELRFPPPVAPVLAEARPAFDEPARARLLDHCRWVLRTDGATTSPYLIPWPRLPASGGLPDRLFYAFVLLAEVPRLRAWHAERGVPDDVSCATMADLGRHLAIHHEIHGHWGFDEMPWCSLHFLGQLFELGRLQFQSSVLWIPVRDDAGERCPLGPMAPVLDVHIPETGPLDPAACDESFARAGRFFAAHLPERPYEGFTCLSWLLAEQLADLLPAASNIVRFQRRFRVVPTADPWDGDVRKFIFRVPDATPVDELPTRTRLEQVVVSWLREHGEWRSGLGCRRAP